MTSFTTDFTSIAATKPGYLKAISLDEDGKIITLEFWLRDATATAAVVLPTGFATQYPNCGAVYNGCCLSPGRVAAIVDQVHEIIVTAASEGQWLPQWSSCRTMSDDADGGMAVYPTMDVHIDDIAMRHAQLTSDVEGFKRVFGPTSVSVAELTQLRAVEVTLIVPLEGVVSAATAEAFQLTLHEPIVIQTVFERQAYLEGDATACGAVSVTQRSHIAGGNARRGVCAQLGCILTQLVKNAMKRAKERAKGAVQTDDSSGGPTAEVAATHRLLELGFDEIGIKKALKALAEQREDAAIVDVAAEVEAASQWIIKASENPIEAAASEEGSDVPTATAPTLSIVEKKRVPPIDDDGFLVQLARYAVHRIPSVCDFCVTCDRPHLFGSGMLLRPSVCSRQACAFAFQHFSVGADAACEIAADLGVIDLLWCIGAAAAKSSRWTAIFTPFPLVFDPKEVAATSAPLLDPNNKNIDLARAVFQAFPPLRQLSTVDDAGELRTTLEKAHPLAYPTLQWVLQSNRCLIRKIPSESHIDFMGTPYQFLFSSAAPERQTKFEALKAKHGTEWAFHGSRAENWHSILRNGLKNASGTNLQLNGQAYGKGIYLSPSASVSFGYSQIPKSEKLGTTVDDIEAQFIDPTTMLCIAICEVVKLDIKKSGNIWVTPHEEGVMTRFLLVYTRGFSQGHLAKIDEEDKIAQLNQLAAKLM
eukprot:PhM_4_TR15655/c0_g1_i1/m.61338/K15258/PARP6_8; poly [ADP-ribose] polymerase 6/8